MNTSIPAIMNAIGNHTGRFKTIKDFSLFENNVEQSIISSDKYSISFLANVNGEESIIKVFYNNSDFIEKVKASMYKTSLINLPFMYKFIELKEELLVLKGKDVNYCDVFISPWLGVDIISTLDIDDNNKDTNESIIKNLASITYTMLSLSIVPDRFSIEGLRYINNKVTFSLSETFIIIDDNVSNKSMIAFARYMLYSILNLIKEIAIRNSKIDNAIVDYAFLEHTSDIERFDNTSIDYIFSDSFNNKINSLIEYCAKGYGWNADIYIKAIEAEKISDILNIFADISKEIFVPNLTDKVRSKYFKNSDYEIIGDHSEDRVSLLRISDGKQGYINFAGDLIVDLLYDNTTDFREGIAVCKKGELYGAIDRHGIELLPFTYQRLKWDSITNSFTFADKDGKRGKIKRKDLPNI